MFLNISQSSQENTCVRVPFLIKLQAWSLKSTSSLKERLWYRYFPVNLRRLFLQNTSGGCFYEQWLQFHIWFIMTLYYKMWQILQSVTTILLQNSTNVSHKMREVFYFITKCNSYYKMQSLFQNASVHNSLWTNDTDYIFNTNVTELLRIYALSCFSYFRGDRSR